MKAMHPVLAIGIATLILLSGCGEAPRQSAPAPTVAPPRPGNPLATLATRPNVSPPSDLARPTGGAGLEYLDSVPMSRLITTQRGPVQTEGEITVPLITWGGDVATIYANGGATTQPGSIFAREGLAIRLAREDDFVRGVEKVIAGETPYLRGTVDMVSSALEVLQERGVEMVVIYQMTWSTGGDAIVVRSDQAASPGDLRGKAIGMQRFGPHMLYLATVLRDAGLSPSDVRIRWLREITIPPYDAGGLAVDPSTAIQRDPDLAAVTVISPDMLALTSGGAIGTGAESSVRGAKLLLSTKTAGAVIADVYAVRKDYFDAQRDKVQAFVRGLLAAQEELVALTGAKQQRAADYERILRQAAEILRDSSQATADIDAMLQDCSFVGYAGNEQFFTGQGTLRSFDALTREAQQALIDYGLISRPIPLAQARWDYRQLTAGAQRAPGQTSEPRFDTVRVERLARDRELRGATKEGVLFEFEIRFEPNQNEFPSDLYRTEFGRVLSLASTYPGAVIFVEGHADPLKYVQERQQGLPTVVLEQTKQAAKNLSVQRAIAVRDSVVNYTRTAQITLDPSQFTVIGAGIERPRFPNPNDEQQWRANMRVAFQITQVEAELQQFSRP